MSGLVVISRGLLQDLKGKDCVRPKVSYVFFKTKIVHIYYVYYFKIGLLGPKTKISVYKRILA